LLSTHFVAPHRPQERELHWLDLLARQAADLLERARARESLKTAQRQLQQHALHLEDTVAERTSRLRETVEELEAFSYSIAHDMRAPLRALQGFASILNTDYVSLLDETARHYLQRIASAARRMDTLILDILNYGKVMKRELELRPVQVEDLIREILSSYPALDPAQADICLQTPLPPVLANEAALTQIVSNLLGNAVKFVAPGVRPQVLIRAEMENGSVRLWFEDNGIGIPKESQDKLFNIFTRLNRLELYEGTGIGLAIVRKAAERMGGQVGVESEPDRGSRFWVRLKLAEAAPASQP
jgi:signal transduction histidine kinase